MTVIHIGVVNSSAVPTNAHAAKNLPSTKSHVDIGRVIKSSMVPLRRSSAHKRMEIAGIKRTYSHG